jgi:hypothetical protein
MYSIVGARMARVTLRGINFGDGQAALECGDYKVQMKGIDAWIDLPVISWNDGLIEWNLPPGIFNPYESHRIRVETPTGISNERKYYVLPAPTVDRVEDNTGQDAQGPLGGWLTVYSQGTPGTFSNVRKKSYEDTSDGACPSHYYAIYVVTLNGSGKRYGAKVYKKWSKDSFKVQLENLWEDLDSDYYKDKSEPGNVAVQPGAYSVQVCLVTYADTNGNGRFSGNRDSIYQVVRSKSEIIYDINRDPWIVGLKPQPREPNQTLVIKGHNFGANPSQEDAVHIGKKTFSHTNRRIKAWTDTKIRIRVPNYRCETFGQNSSMTRKVWVTVGGVNSNKRSLAVNKPASCP